MTLLAAIVQWFLAAIFSGCWLRLAYQAFMMWGPM